MDWRENVKEGGGKVRSVGVGFKEGSITNGSDDQRSAWLWPTTMDPIWVWDG